MTDEQHPEALRVREDLHELNLLVFRAIEHGIERALEYFSGRAEDPWLFSHIVRDGALELLPEWVDAAAVPCELTRNPMSGIELSWNGWTIRVWKKPNGEHEYLQPPGESGRRQSFYNQIGVQDRLGGMDSLFVSNRNLVYVWDRNGADIDLLIVKPFGFDDIWKAGNIEWKVVVDHPASFVEPSADFSDEDDNERFDIELDRAGTEDDDPDFSA